MIHKRKSLFMSVIIALTFAGLMILLTGCGGGLPKELKKEARAIPDAVKAGKSRMDKYKDKYKDLTKSSEFKPLEKFALKENWAQKFQLAQNELSRAETLYGKDLSPLLDQNEPKLAPRVKQEIARIKKILTDADTLSRYPFSRFSMIKKTIDNAKNLHARAKTDADQIKRIANEIKTGPMAKAIIDFPDLSGKIKTRFAPLSRIEDLSRGDLEVVLTEYKKHRAGSPADYAAFTDSSIALSSGLEQVRALETKLTREISQLYQSYTKILKDMKVVYFVTIKRESWDDYSDYYNPRTVTFQRQVSPEAYEVLTDENKDTIAAITAGFMGSKFSSSIGGLWNTLSINPAEQWERGHNAASFWVEDSKEVYYHKYLLEENGETKETGWEKVNENFYEANFEYLGMAILAKPYGVFEQDRLTQAAPPGMAYVGNAKYGEWKKDEKGDRFWSWYGKYALFSSLFFFPRSHYYYNSWNGWHNNYRHQKPYFGKTRNGFQKYGTSGTYVKKSPRFQSTNFAKSGGFRSPSSSVRGAGPGLRGGGPKNKGK